MFHVKHDGSMVFIIRNQGPDDFIIHLIIYFIIHFIILFSLFLSYLHVAFICFIWLHPFFIRLFLFCSEPQQDLFTFFSAAVLVLMFHVKHPAPGELSPDIGCKSNERMRKRYVFVFTVVFVFFRDSPVQATTEVAI